MYSYMMCFGDTALLNQLPISFGDIFEVHHTTALLGYWSVFETAFGLYNIQWHVVGFAKHDDRNLEGGAEATVGKVPAVRERSSLSGLVLSASPGLGEGTKRGVFSSKSVCWTFRGVVTHMAGAPT